MPRQKLPDTYEGKSRYDDRSRAIEGDGTVIECHRTLMSVHGMDGLGECYAVTALAVIRNAGQDRVYDLARRLVNATALCEEIETQRALKELIDSLEEPES